MRYFLLRRNKAKANPIIIGPNKKLNGIGSMSNKESCGAKLIIIIPK